MALAAPAPDQLIEALSYKHVQRFHQQLRLPTESDARLRALVELLIDDAMFAARWGHLAGDHTSSPTTQLPLALG